MKVPSFFHSMRAGVAASLYAEQLSSAELPRMASVSWGSTVNQKGLKGCAAEPKGVTEERSYETSLHGTEQKVLQDGCNVTWDYRFGFLEMANPIL